MQITEIGTNKNRKNHEKEILYYVNYPDYVKGRNYYKNYITLKSKEREETSTTFYFDVESERTYEHYDCNISVNKKGEIIDHECTCMQFASYESCKHLAACLYNYQDEIFIHEIDDKELENITQYKKQINAFSITLIMKMIQE